MISTKRIKIVTLSICIFLLTLLNNTVFARGLIYDLVYTDPNNSGGTYKFYNSAQASSLSISSYINTMGGLGRGWIGTEGRYDNSIYGGRGWYSCSDFIFHPAGEGTNYNNPNGDVPVFYDQYPGVINDLTDSFDGFTGASGLISRTEGTELNEDLRLLYNSETFSGKWKVTANYVRIDAHLFSDDAVNKLVSKYKGKYDLANGGVLFSRVSRTQIDSSQYTQNMDTSWKFYNATAFKGWGLGTRGMNQNGTYKVGASSINHYDNYLRIPEVALADRDVYIRYVDEKGNILSVGTPSYQQLVNGNDVSIINSLGGSKQYHESYRISGTNSIRVSALDSLVIGKDEYEFQYGKGATASGLQKFSNALSKIQTSSNTWTGISKTFGNSSKNDTLVINLYYKKVAPPSIQKLPDLSLIGRLCFISHDDDNYINSTTGTEIDYIPTTGNETKAELRAYIDGAYPYIVRGLRYRNITRTNDLTTTVTVSKPFSYTLKWGEHSGCTGYYYTLDNPNDRTNLEIHQRAEPIGGAVKDNHHVYSCYTMTCNGHHAHTSACYKTSTTPSCGKREHTHTTACDYVSQACPGYEHKHNSSCYRTYLDCPYGGTHVEQPHPSDPWGNGNYCYSRTCGTQHHYFNSGRNPSQCGCYYNTGVVICQDYHYSGNLEKKFNYELHTEHTAYEVLNFKMYRISKFILYDDESNTGGKLFNTSDRETIYTSEAYNQIFNSGGLVKSVLRVTTSNSGYPLEAVNNHNITNVAGVKNLIEKVQNHVNSVTAKEAAEKSGLNYTFTGIFNDYIDNLDGRSDMLNKNDKSLSNEKAFERLATNYIGGNSYIYISNIGKYDGRVTGMSKNTLKNKIFNTTTSSYLANVPQFMNEHSKDKLTNKDDFDPYAYFQIPINRENGLRSLKSEVIYASVPVKNNQGTYGYNYGSDSFNASIATYGLKNVATVPGDYTNKQTKLYSGDNEVNRVIVFTPISVSNFKLTTETKVEHTEGSQSDLVIQKNAQFTIDPQANLGTCTSVGYKNVKTAEFIKGYYYLFDFDVEYAGKVYAANKPIYIAGATSVFYGRAVGNVGETATSINQNRIKVAAVSVNASNILEEAIFGDWAAFKTNNIKEQNKNESTNKFVFNSNKNNELTPYMDLANNFNITRLNNMIQNQPARRTDLVSDAYHTATTEFTTKTVSRIFDFKITDCTDLAFKKVFRKTNNNNVNSNTGIVYSSGIKYWNMYNFASYNSLENRTEKEKETIIPLGPYSNTDKAYINSPKMGYRISFDLKTTGYITNGNNDNERYIEITPSYYYISKDGKTFDNNIKLYYMNTNSKYVDLSTSNYTIYYKPNDGYRYLSNTNFGIGNNVNLSTEIIPLNINKLKLTNKSMGLNNTGFLQAWYGEFKLPNSTIAVSNGKDINNHYTDGYIGVIFDIKCYTKDSSTMSYGTNDKGKNPNTNTSQWDYEGYMNWNFSYEASSEDEELVSKPDYKGPGTIRDTFTYKLERGTWNIDNTLYQKIKGTVALFDLDNRAADDFE